MKIKEIVLRENTLQTGQGIEGTVARIDQNTVVVNPKNGGTPIEVPKDQIVANQGELQATTSNPIPTPGAKITLLQPTGQSAPLTATSTTSTPPSTTSATSNPTSTANNPTSNPTSTTPPQTTDQLKVEEIDEEDPSEFSDSELIQAATHKGMEDSLKFDDDGVLANRNEIIDLLQNGQEFGGDPTDDFISDVEDDEYDQLLEKIKHLSGL